MQLTYRGIPYNMPTTIAIADTTIVGQYRGCKTQISGRHLTSQIPLKIIPLLYRGIPYIQLH